MYVAACRTLLEDLISIRTILLMLFHQHVWLPDTCRVIIHLEHWKPSGMALVVMVYKKDCCTGAAAQISSYSSLNKNTKYLYRIYV